MAPRASVTSSSSSPLNLVEIYVGINTPRRRGFYHTHNPAVRPPPLTTARSAATAAPQSAIYSLRIWSPQRLSPTAATRRVLFYKAHVLC